MVGFILHNLDLIEKNLKSFLFFLSILYIVSIRYIYSWTIEMIKDSTKKFFKKIDKNGYDLIGASTQFFINRKKDILDLDCFDFTNCLSICKSNKQDQKNQLFSGNKLECIIEKTQKKSVVSTKFNMIYCAIGSYTKEKKTNEYIKEDVEINGRILTKTSTKHKLIEYSVLIDKPFLLGEVEVTQELYEFVINKNPSKNQDKKNPIATSKHPIENITWYNALEFCNELSRLHGFNPYYKINDRKHNMDVFVEKLGGNGYRLPDEKEWEYAFQAGTKNHFAGTNSQSSLHKYAWYKSNSKIDPSDKKGQTHPVATKKPNEWGFYDMMGNVAEMCYDPTSSTPLHRATRGGDCEDSLVLSKDLHIPTLLSRDSWFTGAVGVDVASERIGFRIARSFF